MSLMSSSEDFNNLFLLFWQRLCYFFLKEFFILMHDEVEIISVYISKENLDLMEIMHNI